MARPSETACTIDNFLTQSVADAGGGIGSCIKGYSSQELKAAMVFLKAWELAALGGTDYTEQLGGGGTLVEAAACYHSSLDYHQRQLARLVIQTQNTNSSGADGYGELTDGIACLKNFDENTLDAMDLLLTCLLGRHAAYPQTDL